MTDPGSPLVLTLTPGTVPPLVAVRRWAGSELADLGEDHLVAVQTVTTELLTNAHQHGHGARELRLRRDHDPCRIRIEVDDGGDELPEPDHPLPDASHGRGLVLVAKLAQAWNSRLLDGGGKTVWADIDCTTYPWIPCP